MLVGLKNYHEPKKLTVYIVVADYYKDITNSLTNAAVKFLKKNNFNYEIIKVPGVYEIPQFINWKINSKKLIYLLHLVALLKETPIILR